MMFIHDSNSNNATQDLTETKFQPRLPYSYLSSDFEQSVFIENMIGDLMDGILILTDQRKLIYANNNAHRILHQLNRNEPHTNDVPKEIWHICQSLIQSRNLFPNQHWLIQSDIFIEDSATLHVRARWLKIDAIAHPCLLLVVEDKHQAIQNIAIDEAEHYSLTPREKEVWLLHRTGYTYKQIAIELEITPNTVKKHMKNIHVKQKKLLDSPYSD